ncbi:hypothetical protein BDW71DRAFT_3482 [Aspergillus fruticulosus]
MAMSLDISLVIRVDQIRKHFKKGTIGRVVHYHAGAKLIAETTRLTSSAMAMLMSLLAPGTPPTFRAKDRKRELTSNKKGKAKKNSNTAAEDAEQDNDWILACRLKMPSAKLTKIKDIVLRWKTSSKGNKVVIFN